MVIEIDGKVFFKHALASGSSVVAEVQLMRRPVKKPQLRRQTAGQRSYVVKNESKGGANEDANGIYSHATGQRRHRLHAAMGNGCARRCAAYRLFAARLY